MQEARGTSVGVDTH